MFAEQNFPRMLQPPEIEERLFREHFEMLRRIFIDERDGVLLVAGQHNPANRPAQHSGGIRHTLRPHFLPEFRDRRPRLFRHTAAPGHEKRRTVRPVLRLDQEIKPRQPPVHRIIGKHDQLARSRRRSGIDQMRHHALRRTHPRTARPDNLRDFRHGLSAIGNRCDTLRAACLEHLVHARHTRRNQGRIVNLAVRPRRRDHDHLFHPRHLRGDRCHQRNGGKRALATRHITRRRRDRRNPVTGKRPGADFMQPHFLWLLVLVEFPDRDSGIFHRLAHIGCQSLLRGIEIRFRRRNLVCLHRRLVEVARKPRQCLVTLGPHRVDNLPHLVLIA